MAEPGSVAFMYTVARWAVLAVFLLIVFFAVRSLWRPTPFSLPAEILNAALLVLAAAGYFILVGAPVNVIWTVALVAVGLFIGFVLSKSSRVTAEGNKLTLKHSAIPYLVLMAAYLVSLSFNLFGTKVLMSGGMALVLGATALAVASHVAGTLKARAG